MISIFDRSKPFEGKTIKVICIDNSQEYLNVSKFNLEKIQPNLFSIDSYDQANEILKLNLDNYDVIISGYNLKPFNGIDLLSKIRNEIKHSIPFIFLTKMVHEDIAIKALNLGANYYIKKREDTDYQFTELFSIIVEVVTKNRFELALRYNNSKYQSIFEDAPILIWEQDWTKLKNKFDDFRKMGIKTGDELKIFFLQNPHEVGKYAQLIDIIDVNKATLEFYHKSNKNEFTGPLIRFLTDTSEFLFINEVAAFYDGKTKFSIDLDGKTVFGEDIYVHLRSSIPPGFENTFSRVIVLIIDLTKQKEAELNQKQKEIELLESESKNEAIIDAIPDLILEINEKGVIISYHGDIKNYFILNKEIKGSLLSESIPELADIFQQIIVQTLTSNKSQNFEYSIQFPEETGFFNAKTAKLASNLVLIIIRNVTQQKNIDNLLSQKEIAEQKLVQLELSRELRQEEQKFHVLVKNAPNIIFTTDQDGFITFINSNFLNLDINEIIGKSFIDLVNPSVKNQIKNFMSNVVSTGETVSFEIETAINNETIWYLLNLGGLKEEGKVTNFIFIVTDTTKEKEIEKKLVLQSEKIEQTNKDLKEFAYVVSHDLRSPLQVIDSLIEKLFDEKKLLDESNLNNSLRSIKRRVNLMEDLIKGILDYSNIGISEESKETINLNEIINEVINILDPDKKCEFSVSSNLPSIFCNRIRIYQLFQNLISNAIKYNDKDKVIIKITSKVVNSSECEFRITDNGMGINPENYDRIFKLFIKTNENKDSQSSGIGLAIVKKIIDLLEGRIWIESVFGEKTTFIFTIPIKYCRSSK